MVAAGIVACAGAVAYVLGRRQQAGRQPVFGRLPSALDPAPLGLADGGIVVFVDPGCSSCAGVLGQVEASGRPFAAIDVVLDPSHGVRDVPATLVVAADGTVTRS